jgi:hypothetical protein
LRKRWTRCVSRRTAGTLSGHILLLELVPEKNFRDRPS